VPTRLTATSGPTRIKLIVDEWQLPAAPASAAR
jgi:hypothetical protein